jgi:hypothetical protein
MTRRRAPRPLSAEQLRILQRLAQLRAATAPQLHALLDFLRESKPRTTYARLERLVRDGYVRTDLIRPERGRFSPYFYGLASAGLAILKRENERSVLLTRPRQPILRYLLFRNEIYARARMAGWLIASPVLASPEAQLRYLQVFNEWAIDAKKRELAEVQARGWGPMDVAAVKQDAEQLPRFLPKALSFEALLKLDRSGRATDVVLLIVDDPRRSVKRQSEGLPHVDPERTHKERKTERHYKLPGLRLLLRDVESEYDLTRAEVFKASTRLRTWRRVLLERFGETKGRVLLSTDTLFPDLWAHRVGERPATAAPTAKEAP